MNGTCMDRIEILSVELLDKHRSLVEELKQLANRLGLEFGWHYLLDLTWIISWLGDFAGKNILDGGAGSGILQWYLAHKGATVYSVDRESRANLPWRFRRWVKVQGLRPSDLNPPMSAVVNALRSSGAITMRLRSAYQVLQGPWRSISPENEKSPGIVWIYNQDLQQLVDIADNSVDAVVALSALEHNPPSKLPIVVAELMRALKPGGILLATLGAARDQDWFHKPSRGWCYSEATLRNAFDLAKETPSNYGRYDELFEALRNCAELKENLAKFYFRSGDNGMPWGVWDPKYQSVGVVKIKE